MKRLAFLFTFCAALNLLPGTAMAHPHAWIIMNATLQFNAKGQMTGIYQEWRFDKEYSKVAVEGLDANKDGYFSPGELDPLTAENIKALWEYEYFTKLRLAGKKTKFAKVTEYSQYFANNILTMSFTIPLKTPIDPKNRKIVLKIYDPTFYIAMDYQKNNPVSATGPMPAMCKVELKPVPSDSEVMQTKKLLANKSKEWQPKTEEDFGALFAQPVLLDCVSKSAS